MPSSKSSMCAGACVLFVFLAGCSSSQHSPSANAMTKANLGGTELALGMDQAPARPTRIVSLGAGDALGRQVYFNDVVLAAGQRSRELESLYGTSALRRGVIQVGVPVNADTVE